MEIVDENNYQIETTFPLISFDVSHKMMVSPDFKSYNVKVYAGSKLEIPLKNLFYFRTNQTKLTYTA